MIGAFNTTGQNQGIKAMPIVIIKQQGISMINYRLGRALPGLLQ